MMPAELTNTLNNVAEDLMVNPQFLEALIEFESGWNPQIKNPRSSARGLIQFTNAAARDLGFTDSAALVAAYPTAEAQLKGPVKQYLSRYAPFPNRQSLYMAVFYPAARKWEPNKHFPDSVKKANPGINTPQDYVNFVSRRLMAIKKKLSKQPAEQ